MLLHACLAAALTQLVLAGDEKTDQAGLVKSNDAPEFHGGERLQVLVSTVGPYHNPHEAYPFSSLPICMLEQHGTPRPTSWLSSMGGELWSPTDLYVRFPEISNLILGLESSELCSTTLNARSAAQLELAVRRHFWYRLSVDSLTASAFVGVSSHDPDTHRDRHFIYSHLLLKIGYRGFRVITVDLHAQEPVLIAPGTHINFTYQLEWHMTRLPAAARVERYLERPFFEHRLRRVALHNGVLIATVLFAVALVSLSTAVRQSFTDWLRAPTEGAGPGGKRMNGEAERGGSRAGPAGAAGGPGTDDVGLGLGLGSLEDERSWMVGWKRLGKEVRREAAHPQALAAVLGAGVHVISTLLLFVYLMRTVSPPIVEGVVRRNLLYAFSITSSLGGVAAALASPRSASRLPKLGAVCAACLPSAALLCYAAFINLLAWCSGALPPVPSAVLSSGLLSAALVAVPSSLAGAALVCHIRRGGAGAHVPTVSKAAALNPIHRRPIHPGTIMAAGGFIPFLSIWMEVFLLLSSLFGHKVYYLYSYISTSVIVLSIVSGAAAMLATRVALNSGEARWQWIALGSGGSTGVYVLIYAAYFALVKTTMGGLLQLAAFALASMLIACTAALVSASSAYVASALYVKGLYANVKTD